MKSIILAAGSGTRLRPLTNTLPKCMVEYQGKPIIEHIIDTHRECSISEIILVTGYCKEKLARYGLKTYVNHNFQNTNMVSTLFCAENEFNDDLIISYADIIYRPRILKALIDSPHEFSITIDLDWLSQWQVRMSDPLLDAETMILDGDRVIELGKKPTSYQQIEGQYMGLIKISKTSLTKVREFYHSLDKNILYDGKDFNNMYMTSFIQQVINKLMPVYAVKVSAGWCEFDCLSDLQLEWAL